MVNPKRIIGGTIEAIKEVGGELGETFSPGALLEHALKGGRKEGEGKEEFRQLLGLEGSSFSSEELARREKEIKEKDEEEKKKARAILGGLPPHMELPKKPPEPRPYEKTWKDEEERKKAKMVEAQKKSPAIPPAGRKKVGSLFVRRKPTTYGFEGWQKDRRIG